MSSAVRKICLFLLLSLMGVSLAACGNFLPGDNKANAPLSDALQSALGNANADPGAAMVVRIFKQEKTLEVWKQSRSGAFRMIKSYDICAFSGELGPKIKEGDRQSPEGFYNITPGLMNPRSNYFLAFNTGFPNKFDRSWDRTGSDLMVHGDCSSRGCYAMTDQGIAEIYALARETFKGGNPTFQLEIFPFHMTVDNLAKQSTNANMAFWKNIKEGYDLFDLNQAPPSWDVCEKKYVFNAPGTVPLDATGPCPVISKPQNLLSRQAADDAAMVKAVANVQQTAAQQAADALQQANAKAAAKAQGDAINGAVNGFIGHIMGQQDVPPVMSGKPAPVPMPPLQRT